MKTFEYLDELIGTMILLENVKDAICNWQDGKHSESQKAYNDFTLSHGFIEGSPEEEYIYWKCNEHFGNKSYGNLKTAIQNLKDKGYT